ncbi:WD40 repeat domain-containing protein [Streptomyces sp. H27-S2]|uniref:WD40 repeat domain-containing protein n=1 Tax=Streptomyces antarcticus TaxID=2996458 RepID=UPI00226DE5FA|nr:hypothetical protein [Streptomyces sp. H27-S2]MCY0949977.1 hypothetical protein [Streptomyces sp. H27-S2]
MATLAGDPNEVGELLAFSPDGQILAVAQRHYTVRLWNAASRQDIAVLERHEAEILALAFHPGGRLLASAGRDGKAFLWDTASGSTTADFTGGEPIGALAFSPDGKTLAAGRDKGTVRLWNVP